MVNKICIIILMKSKKVKYGNRTGTKKAPFFGNYDIYSNPKPKDTVRIKYGSLSDVKFTIEKLEDLYKRKRRPHARISKIANVLEQRLRVLSSSRKTRKISSDIGKRHKLAKRYFAFLKKRTTLKSEDARRNLKFT